MTVAGSARGNSPLTLHPRARLRDILATIIALLRRLPSPRTLLGSGSAQDPTNNEHSTLCACLDCPPEKHRRAISSAHQLRCIQLPAARWPRKGKRRLNLHHHRQRIRRSGAKRAESHHRCECCVRRDERMHAQALAGSHASPWCISVVRSPAHTPSLHPATLPSAPPQQPLSALLATASRSECDPRIRDCRMTAASQRPANQTASRRDQAARQAEAAQQRRSRRGGGRRGSRRRRWRPES